MNTIKLNKNKVSLKQCNNIIEFLNQHLKDVKLELIKKDQKFNGFVMYELIKTKIKTNENKIVKYSTLRGIQHFLIKSLTKK
mgnify:FL=1|jgi:hypothetical protein|tara:strand:- start:424 stop:669 length:246 start_codon:yes stop_codon:yes gene_type:complete